MVFWVALVGALVLTGALIVVLRRARVLDVPNARSSHHVPTPRGGGIAVMVVIVIASFAADPRGGWTLLVPALALAAVGLADDLRTLPAKARLLVQVLVAVAMTLILGVQSQAGAGLWLVAFLVIGSAGMVAYVNAFNFMDGVNGISALQGALAGGWFVFVGAKYDMSVLVVVGAAMAGACLGFLPWNATGRIFLGDVGSYGLGALIALGTLAGWAEGVPPLVVLAPLVVYLADTGWALFKRARAGASLTEPHRDHVYQRLVRLGWPHLVSAGWSTLVAAAACLGVSSLANEATFLTLVVLAALAVLYLAGPWVVERVARSGQEVA